MQTTDAQKYVMLNLSAQLAFAVRASMLMSAPEQPSAVAPDARDQQEGIRNKPRK